VRGDIYELKANPRGKGHEQQGRRYAVVLQSDALPLSTVLAAPTTTGSWDTSFHVEIELNGQRSRVLLEQMTALDPTQRFGRKVGRIGMDEQAEIDRALKLVLGLF